MEFTIILPLAFFFLLLKKVLDQKEKARSENLRVLEEALRNPAIDRTTLENLTWQLTGARPARAARQGPSRFLAFVLAIGWIALFVGLGLWVTGSMVHSNGMTTAGVITAIVGFGLVTYPFALRELESRKQT